MGKLDDIKIRRTPYEPDETSIPEPVRRKLFINIVADIYRRMMDEEREKQKEAEKSAQEKGNCN